MLEQDGGGGGDPCPPPPNLPQPWQWGGRGCGAGAGVVGGEWEGWGGSARVSVCMDFGKRSLRLHDAAFVLVVMRVLKSESLLWSVFFQVGQLLAVDGSSSLLSDELDGILILHPTLDQGQRDEDGSSPQAGHAVHSHAAAWVFTELGLQQVEPIFYYLAGRRGSIIKRPVHYSDAILLQGGFVIGDLAHPYHRGGTVFLQVLQEGAERGIGGVVGDEEPHVFVADFHGRRAVHSGHGGMEEG